MLIRNAEWQLLEGDCVERLREVPDGCVDALVTDPPYGLSRDLDPDELARVIYAWAMGERRDVDGRGFMGCEWDSFVPGPHVWREVLRVLKPGAHLAVFAGSRTFDLMSLSLRLAGAQVRDSIMLAGWLYGSGFPKSLNFEGGLGTALKPAFEPVILLRKSLDGTIARTLDAFGTGVLRVGDCRVGSDNTQRVQRGTSQAWEGGAFDGERETGSDCGRWPANLVLVHSPRCEAYACAPECPTHELDAQAGERKSGARKQGVRKGVGYRGGKGDGGPAIEASSGGASRFFPQFYYAAKASRRERELGCEALPPKTGAEATKREADTAGLRNPRAGAGRTAAVVRNWHPTVKPLSLIRWLTRLCCRRGGLVLDPFAGSGTTLAAALLEGCDALGVELGAGEAAIARARIAFWEGERDELAREAA